MKILKYIQLVVIGSAALLLASCSSMKTMIEPEAYIRYDKEEFDYTDQVMGEATSVKILMVDWKRLFSTQTGKVSSASSSISGLLPGNKLEGYALHNLISSNPGYDIIVYPQYEVSKKAPGLGIFYQKNHAKATARMALTNDFYAVEGSGVTPQSKEMEASLVSLQTAYDDLVAEVSEIKEASATKEAELQNQVQLAEAKATKAEKASVEAATTLPSVPQENATKPETTPPLSSNKMSSSSEVKTVTGTYTLIIGSYSNSENAERAVADFNSKYSDLNGRVGIVVAGEKFRIGFINFKTRNDAIAYKNSLLRKYPEFKNAWPYKP